MVNSKPGKPRLRTPARPSVLGSGLLERARSTTFALLGVTAAVGLAIVALALNQSWPVVAGSPIPGASTGDEGVGAARVVSRADAPRRSGPGAASAGRSGGSRADRASGATPAAPGEGSRDLAPSGSGESVYASAPVRSKGKGASQEPPQAAPDSRPEPVKPQPQVVAPDPSPPPAAPVAPPATEAEAETPSPPATASSAPPEEESHVPSWSQGRGHAYGRSDRD